MDVRENRLAWPARWKALSILTAGLGLAVATVAVCAAPAEHEGIFLLESGTDEIHLSDHGDNDGRTGRLIVPTAGTRPPAGLRQAGRDPTGASGSDDRAFFDIIATAARAQRLEPELLHAVIGVESGYAPRAVSPRGAMGLMQLMPATVQAYGVTDALDPRQNVLAGARYLRSLLDLFGQDTTLALAAYNAGPTAVWRHHSQVPPFAETVAYVPKVLARYAALREFR